MLKIWGRNNSSNVQKVMWAVGEMGLAHEREDVGGPFGGNDQDWYQKMNPNGRVPTISDDGFILWESNVIVRYLAAKHGAGGLYPADAQARAVAEQWMDWQQTTINPAIFGAFWGLVRTPEAERDAAAIQKSMEETTAALGHLDAALDGRQFIMGDAFTMADIPGGIMTYRFYELGMAQRALPNLRAWYERLQTRAAYREHVMLPIT